jgi:hypothetical protein
MNLINQKLITLILVTNILTSTVQAGQITDIPLASPTPSPSPKTICNQVIKACDKALEDKNKQIKLSDLAIKKLTDDNTELNKKVEESEDKLGSFWRNPYFLVGLGILGTLILTKPSR